MHTDVRVERDNVRLFTWWLISKGLEYKKNTVESLSPTLL